jgi:hypothetical protein
MNHDDRLATGILFGFALLTAATYVVTRTFAISVFLARVGSDHLPVCILASAVAVILFSWLSGKLLRYLDPCNLAALTWLLLAGACYWIAVMIPRFGDAIWILSGLYVFAEIRGCVNTIFLVTMINDAFADSATKKPFALVASGAPVAGIVVGTLLGVEASVAALVPTLALMTILDLMAAGLIWFSRRKLTGAAMVQGETRALRGLEVKQIFRSGEHKYRIQLAALFGIKIIALTLIGYQWEVTAGTYFGANEAEMVAYFAIFYAVSDVLIVGLQWLVSGKLLDRFGVGVALLGYPLMLLLVGLISLLTDSVVTLMVLFTIARGLHVVRRAIHDPALNVAYTVLRPEIRRDTIVLIKGIIKPFSEAATALILIFVGVRLSHVGTTMIWMLLVPAWLVMAWRATVAFTSAKSQTDECFGQTAR